MKPGAKLAAFALVLAAAFGGGAAMGAVFEPEAPAPEPVHDMSTMRPGETMDHTNMSTTTTTTTTTTAPAP